MKTLLTFILISVLSITVSAKQYYVFDTEAEAEAALTDINSDERFPIVGRNAATGELEPNKQQTTCWVKKSKQRKDGKWVFERLPTAEIIKIKPEKAQKFKNDHKYGLEDHNKNWFPELEVEL